ncbi:MAG: preprotein translocase subunit SecE, partial [bacterium]
AFLKEVWIETNPKTGKVSWPGKKAIIGSTIAVLIAVVIFSLYLGIVDYISLNIMMFLIK